MTDKAGDNEYKDRSVVGFVEPVTVIAASGEKKRLLARVDSGANRSSIDKKIAEKLSLGPVIGESLVRNANGQSRRQLIRATVQIGDDIFTEEFTLADRTHMNFGLLLGRNILAQGFLIDPEKSHKGEEE